MLAALEAVDKAFDLIIEHWQKLIDAGDETKIREALASLSKAERESDEDDILAQAEEIKKRRG
jgi:hypothetical protein